MIPNHKVVLFEKEILFTPKSIFRIEEARNHKSCYEGLYANADPIKAIICIFIPLARKPPDSTSPPPRQRAGD